MAIEKIFHYCWFGKHFISGGFGVRLMLDILLLTEKYYDRMDWEYISIKT